MKIHKLSTILEKTYDAFRIGIIFLKDGDGMIIVNDLNAVFNPSYHKAKAYDLNGDIISGKEFYNFNFMVLPYDIGHSNLCLSFDFYPKK